jgi:hypothetical protein
LSHPPLTLGQLVHVLQRGAALCQAIDSLGSGAGLPRPPKGRRGWFLPKWPPQLGEWATHSNAASHTGTVTKRQALSLRNRLLEGKETTYAIYGMDGCRASGSKGIADRSAIGNEGGAQGSPTG